MKHYIENKEIYRKYGIATMENGGNILTPITIGDAMLIV